MMRQNPDRMFIPHLQNSRIAGKDETLRPVKLNVLNRQTEVVVFYEQRPTGPQVVQQNLCTCEILHICFKNDLHVYSQCYQWDFQEKPRFPNKKTQTITNKFKCN